MYDIISKLLSRNNKSNNVKQDINKSNNSIYYI